MNIVSCFVLFCFIITIKRTDIAIQTILIIEGLRGKFDFTNMTFLYSILNNFTRISKLLIALCPKDALLMQSRAVHTDKICRFIEMKEFNTP